QERTRCARPTCSRESCDQLRRHCGKPSADGELLARFVRLRDEAAFAELVRRHGGLVGVARRQLGGRDRADDVFQATFLALARRARRLRRSESLVNWLYTVALREASKTRQAAAFGVRTNAGRPGRMHDGTALIAFVGGIAVFGLSGRILGP